MLPQSLLLVNFGGPRSQGEVSEFLVSLLNDPDVIHPKLFQPLHRWLFTLIAKRRSKKVARDYQIIGGCSPIFKDTEFLAEELSKNIPTLAFHRYLPKTHAAFLEKLQTMPAPIQVLPLYPQFSYTTTGSCARFFEDNLPPDFLKKLQWVKSYPDDPGFIEAYISKISSLLKEKGLQEEEVALFFSAHGLPQSYVDEGDPYQKECEASFLKLKAAFPKSFSLLCYQSKFGRAQWIKPSTEDVCLNMPKEALEKKAVMLVPLSFTSDHIETLFEIEKLYLPLIEAKGKTALRCPAIGHDTGWIKTLERLAFQENGLFANEDLILPKKKHGCNCPHNTAC